MYSIHMASNEHHKWLKKRDCPAVVEPWLTQIRTKFDREKVRREISMDDCHIIGSQRKLRHTHILLPL